MSLFAIAALWSLASAAGCNPGANAPLPSPSATSSVAALAKTREKTTDPPQATEKRADLPSPSDCRSLWTDGAERFVLRSQGGNAAFYRELEYVRADRLLRVDDSDLFDGGKELKTARVTKTTKSLTADEAREIEGAFAKACFTEAELARQCAPGGCMRVTVYARGGSATSVENVTSLTGLLTRMSQHFPALRAN